jgi:hypothetical protein
VGVGGRHEALRIARHIKIKIKTYECSGVLQRLFFYSTHSELAKKKKRQFKMKLEKKFLLEYWEVQTLFFYLNVCPLKLIKVFLSPTISPLRLL